MDINNLIQTNVQKLANQILAKDPSATIDLKPAAIQLVQNFPSAQPLADLTITALGVVYKYNIFFAQGQLHTIAIIEQ